MSRSHAHGRQPSLIACAVGLMVACSLPALLLASLG